MTSLSSSSGYGVWPVMERLLVRTPSRLIFFFVLKKTTNQTISAFFDILYIIYIFKYIFLNFFLFFMCLACLARLARCLARLAASHFVRTRAKFPLFTLIWLTAPINVYNSDFSWPHLVTSSIYLAEKNNNSYLILKCGCFPQMNVEHLGVYFFPSKQKDLLHFN